MSQIAIMGGKGVIEETYLQILKQNYYVLDVEDTTNLLDLRTFKLIIFPSRLGVHNSDVVEEIRKNKKFKFRLREFLHKGGRILFFPPLVIPSDFRYCDISGFVNEDSLEINWLPIKSVKYRAYQREAKFRKERHLITEGLNSIDKLKLTGDFQYSGDATPIISKLDREPIVFEVKVDFGSILFIPLNLPKGTASEESKTKKLFYVQLFEKMLNWGLYPVSSSVLFGPLRIQVSEKFGNPAGSCLKKADDKLLENNFSEAGDYAFKAFERIIREKQGKLDLGGAIRKEFPEKSSDGTKYPEFYVCESIRLARNIVFHGGKTPDEVTTEEIEYFISGIKYIIKKLI